MEGSADAEEFHMSPAKITARPGDVLRFVAGSGAPHNVTFEIVGLSRNAHEALNAALVNRTSDLRGPLLRKPGQQYRIVVPRLPPGTYLFYCLPHRSYHEQGELTVSAPARP